MGKMQKSIIWDEEAQNLKNRRRPGKRPSGRRNSTHLVVAIGRGTTFNDRICPGIQSQAQSIAMSSRWTDRFGQTPSCHNRTLRIRESFRWPSLLSSERRLKTFLKIFRQKKPSFYYSTSKRLHNARSQTEHCPVCYRSFRVSEIFIYLHI